jgi:anaerobic magnesium-protoporphyrin IX monomethyl ester cyclase
MKKDGYDIVLFQPMPFGGLYEYKVASLPLGLLYCATALDRAGYGVSIIDQSVDPHWKRNLLSALSSKSICFGITCMTGPQIHFALDVCKLVKEKYPNLPIVWGGIHPTLLPEQTLKDPLIDIVVVGEGEETLLELVQALKAKSPLKNIKGIAFKEEGEYAFTGVRPFIDLNNQPLPAFHLLNVRRYQEYILGTPHVHMHCSRGCTLECAFCWDPVFHRKQFRKMDPSRVLEIMLYLISEYGAKGFLFHDDNFFLDPAWAREVVEKIVRLDLGISLGKLFIRADTLCKMDKEFLDLLVRAGVKRLVMGVESGNPRILELLKKRISLEQVLEANRKLIPFSIRPAYLFMMGLPTETPDEFTQSVRFAERLIKENPKARRSFNIYTPYPGTALFKMALEHGLPEPKGLLQWSKFNYHSVFTGTPWILPETERLVRVMNYALPCTKYDNAFGGLRRQDRGSLLFTKIYGPLARYRVRKMNARFPFELALIKMVRFALGRE